MGRNSEIVLSRPTGVAEVQSVRPSFEDLLFQDPRLRAKRVLNLKFRAVVNYKYFDFPPG
jgi:hypothetical protein